MMSSDTGKPLWELVAAELWTGDLITIRSDATVRDAARCLTQGWVTGAPVVDEAGKLVGVFSLSDVVRWLVQQPTPSTGTVRSCAYQDTLRGRSGAEIVLCTLATGGCPFQREGGLFAGQNSTLCASPHEVAVDWQAVDVNALPVDDVRHYMTADPVVVHRDTPIRDLARLMADGAVHRVIIVGDDFRPTGVVSSLDLVKAMAVAPMSNAGLNG